MIHQYGTDPRHTDEKAQFRAILEKFFDEMERKIPAVEVEVTRDIYEKQSPFVREIRKALSGFLQEKVGKAAMQRVFPSVKDHVLNLCQEGQVTTIVQALSAAEDYLILMFPELTPLSDDRREELLSSIRPHTSSIRLTAINSREIKSPQGITSIVTHYKINPRSDHFSHHDPEVMKAQVSSGRYPNLARALAAESLSIEKIIEAMTTKGFVNLTDLDLWIAEAEKPSVCIDLVGHGAGATFPYVTVERKSSDQPHLKITMRRGFQGSVDHTGEGWTHSIVQRGADIGSELRQTDDPHAKLSQVSDDVGIGVLTSDFVMIPTGTAGRAFIFGRILNKKFGTVLVDQLSSTEWRVRTVMPLGGKKSLRERVKAQLGQILGNVAQTVGEASARSQPEFQDVFKAVNQFLEREGLVTFSPDEIPLKTRNPLNPVVIKDFIKEKLQQFSRENDLPPGALSKILDPLFNFVSSKTSFYLEARDMIVAQEGDFSKEMARLAAPILSKEKAKKASRESLLVSEKEIRSLLSSRTDLDRRFIGKALLEITKQMKSGSLASRGEILSLAQLINYKTD